MKSKHVDLYNTIITPHASEKASADHESGKYVFKVALKATKLEIKNAVESLFNVKVNKVTTLKVKGKAKRFGRSIGKQSDWKKAYVALIEGRIDVFHGD